MNVSTFAPGTLFSHIFHASPVAMTVNALPDGHYIDVNESFTRLVGYSRNELIGRRAIELGILEPRQREQVVQNLLQSRGLANHPQVLRHRSGEARQVIVSAQLEEHEGTLFTVAIIQDLTDYHRTQSVLRAYESRFQLFFESVPLPVLVFDLDGLRILDANPAACRAHEYTLDELCDMTLFDVRVPEEHDTLRAELPGLCDAEPVSAIWQHHKRDGTMMEMAVSGYALDLDGRRVCLAVLRDITQQLAAERALIDSEQRLKIITELSTDGIWDCDLLTKAVHLNEAFRLIYGAPDDVEDLLQWWIDRIHPEDQPAVLRSLQEALASGGSYWSTECRMLRSDGNRYATVIIRGHIIHDDHGRPTHLSGALVDISRQMEIAEATARAALEERQRLARDLHDSVTQSLYSVTLLAEVARRRARAGDAAATLEQIDRLGELSQQCLREMRLLVYELRPAMVEEVGLVGALRQRLEAVEQRSGVRVQLMADDDHRIPLSMQDELFRVAEEALNNALKHAQASNLTVHLRTANGTVELDIADNGRGFDPGQAELSGGQGLSNMRERVTRLGGRFDIDTAVGQETTIRVRLGLPEPDPLAAREPAILLGQRELPL
jgi:PAS domain S-box-containing protein